MTIEEFGKLPRRERVLRLMAHAPFAALAIVFIILAWFVVSTGYPRAPSHSGTVSTAKPKPPSITLGTGSNIVGGAAISGTATTAGTSVSDCIFLVTGGYICGATGIALGDYEFVEAIRQQIPLEAQDAPGPRNAFRKWVMTLEDGKAKAAYLAILDSYDDQDRRAQVIRQSHEKRMKELLSDVPRAKCRRLVEKTPEGGIKATDYKCEAAKASDLEPKAQP